MSAPRRLWLVRHGETEGQSSIRYHGANDVALADAGRKQIGALIPLLQGVAFDLVVHSPLSRAVESAAILLGGLEGHDACSSEVVHADDRLREISFGDAEGMTREEIAAAFPDFWANYDSGKIDAFPGGESRSNFSARIATAITELADGGWHGDALVVAHRGTVSQAIVTLLNEQETSRSAYAVELASLSVLRETASGWALEVLGMTGPMSGPMTGTT